ncbi:MAG: hypothetical protein ACK4TF_08705 [Thermodesulfovibrionales bacterium]
MKAKLDEIEFLKRITFNPEIFGENLITMQNNKTLETLLVDFESIGGNKGVFANKEIASEQFFFTI